MAESLGGRVAALTILGLLLLGAAAYVGAEVYAGQRLPRNASVEGVRVGGLTTRAARERLDQRLGPRAERALQVTLGDGHDVSLDPRKAGLTLDLGASVERARGGPPFSLARAWALVTGGDDQRAVVHLDERRLQAGMDALDAALGHQPAEGTVTFTGGQPHGVYSRSGTVIDRGAARRLLADHLLQRDPVKIPTEVRQPEVSAAEVRRAVAEFGVPAMSGPVTLVLGGQQVQAPPALIAEGLSMTDQAGRLVPVVDGAAVLQALAPVMHTVGDQPQDAGVVLRHGRPVVVPAKLGVEVSPQELSDGLAGVLVLQGAARRLDLHGQVTQPTFSTAAARKLQIRQLVAQVTTTYPHADYLDTNLAQAALLVDGTLLKPGDQFGVDQAVGDPTAAHGFAQGPRAPRGVTQPEDSGMAQLATTVYGAALQAGLRILARTAYPTRVARFPVGRDATVSFPDTDLQFSDDGRFGVLMSVKVTKSAPGRSGQVSVSLWSSPRYAVTLRTGRVTNRQPPGVTYVQGRGCRPSPGVAGFDVSVVRTLRPVIAGARGRTETIRSSYAPVNRIRCGPAPAPPPAPVTPIPVPVPAASPTPSATAGP